MVVEPVYIYLLIILAGLIAYAVFGGADFGAGVWELNTRFRASAVEKQLVYRAIGPVWEANHVWLIFVMVLFWTGFPSAFAKACSLLFVPLFLALAGIVFRGAAYAFRTAYKDVDWHRGAWERVFGIASTAAPFFMGTAIGIWSENKRDRPDMPLSESVEPGSIEATSQWLAWATPHSVFLGFFAVGLCAFLASVFLYRETVVSNEETLIPVWQGRAMTMSLVVGAFSLAGLVVVRFWLPGLWNGICTYSWPLVILSVLGGLTTIYCLWRRYPGTAVVTSAMAVAFVIAAWSVAMFPPVRMPYSMDLEPAVEDQVLWILIGCIAVGMAFVIPPLVWLMRIFKSADTKDY